VVQQFLALYPDPPEDLPLVPPDSPKRPPTRLRFLLSAAFGAASTRPPAPDVRSQATREPVEPIEAIQIEESPELIEQVDTSELESVDSQEPRSTQAPLAAVAHLCTRIGRASKITQLESPLADAVRMLDAVGAVLWAWESHKSALRPRVCYGYADDVLARFPLVGRDADNAIGAAFRSGVTTVVDGTDGGTGAIAVPLLGPDVCVGVLAFEVHHGDERNPLLHAVALIVAAQFVSFCMPPALAEAVNA
jgi:hypothetical protein